MNVPIIVTSPWTIQPEVLTETEDFFFCTKSPFWPYSSPYLEASLELLVPLTETDVVVPFEPEEDPDWIMDCQDYHDLELLFDLTGNLDAPL